MHERIVLISRLGARESSSEGFESAGTLSRDGVVGNTFSLFSFRTPNSSNVISSASRPSITSTLTTLVVHSNPTPLQSEPQVTAQEEAVKPIHSPHLN